MLAAVGSVGCAGQRGTVGARFAKDADGHLYVYEAPEGLGAARAGMKAGDEVLLIDGQDVRLLNEQELHKILSGERGTQIRFTVLREEEVLRLTVQRTAAPARKPSQ
jgi:carboxyl-terminal processing protease